MLARKGAIRSHHFAHASGEACNAGETQAHLFGKKAIESAGGLFLPSIDEYGELGEFARFDTVTIEPLVDKYRPDIVGRLRGVPLLIEIKVTATISAVKQAWLQQQNYSCIEIDLSGRRHQTNEALRESVIRGAPRRWVSHRNRSIPRPKPLLGAISISGGGGRSGAAVSNAKWYIEQTRKDFPNLDEE